MQGETMALAKIGRYKEAQDLLSKYKNLFPNKDSSNLARIITEDLSEIEDKPILTDREYSKILMEQGFDTFWKLVLEEKERTFATKACKYNGSTYSVRCQRLRWFVSVDMGNKGEKLIHYRQTLLRDNIEGAEEMLLFDVFDEYESRYIMY
jgi:hypothetical protein